MKTFVELLKSSVLTQWTITVIVLVIYAVLLFMGKPVPELVETLVTAVVMFYFGSKLGLVQGINQANLSKG